MDHWESALIWSVKLRNHKEVKKYYLDWENKKRSNENLISEVCTIFEARRNENSGTTLTINWILSRGEGFRSVH